jgi:tRNA threonylcarbamoyl adenosine modification protein (Sua5/YciO/YrdC/YwlC family)
VYGIGTRPDLAEATDRIFHAKGRPRAIDLPVLVPSVEAAAAAGELDERARDLVRRFWPGPLTIVVRRSSASRGWELGGRGDTVGLRMPEHPLALAVLERTGPLAVTSANRTGEPTPAACEDVRAIFGALVDVYVCAAGPLGGRPSTIVDLSRAEVRILRAGAIPAGGLFAEP